MAHCLLHSRSAIVICWENYQWIWASPASPAVFPVTSLTLPPPPHSSHKLDSWNSISRLCKFVHAVSSPCNTYLPFLQMLLSSSSFCIPLEPQQPHHVFHSTVLDHAKWGLVSHHLLPEMLSNPRARWCHLDLSPHPGASVVWWINTQMRCSKTDNNLVARTRVHACMLSHFSCVQLFATLWTLACQASLPLRLSREEYWSGLPCPSPGTLPYPGIESVSLISPALTGKFFTTSAPWEAPRTRVLPRYSGLPPMVLLWEDILPTSWKTQDSFCILHPPTSWYSVSNFFFPETNFS